MTGQTASRANDRARGEHVGVHALGYLRLEATDLDAWERFLGEGLVLDVRRRDDVLKARID